MNRIPLIALCVLSLLLQSNLKAAGEDAEFRRAHGYYTLQEYKLAADAFEKYLGEFSKSERADQATLLMAESRYQLKDYSSAAAGFDRFVKEFAQSARRPDALLRAAKVHYMLKEYEKSFAAAELFLKENRPKLGKPDAIPALPAQIETALYYAGEASYSLRNPAQARTYWEELIKTQPDSKLAADASEGLGWIYFDNKEYEQALPRFQFTANAANHPRAAWSKLMEGRTLAALKKYDEALAALKAAPGLSGSGADVEAEAALRSAETLLSAGRYTDALPAFQRLAERYATAPATSQAIAVAALNCADAKHPEEALALVNLYLNTEKSSPDRVALLRLKANILDGQKQNAEALATAKRSVTESAAIADPTRKADEHAASLLLQAELSTPPDSQPYNQIIELYPDSRYALRARYKLAILNGQAGKTDDAYQQMTALLQALDKQPAEQPNLKQLRLDALYAAGELAFRKPDYKAAASHLKVYSDLAGPDDSHADNVARKLAWCHHEQDDSPGAIKILNVALEAYPKSEFRDEMLYLRGLAAGHGGDDADALKFYDQLLKEFPASSYSCQALFDSAVLLMKANKPSDALQRLSQLLQGKDDGNPMLRVAAYKMRAAILLQNGKFAEADADAQAVLKAPEPKKDAAGVQDFAATRRSAMMISALSLVAQGSKQAEAEAALTKLIDEGPPTAGEVRNARLQRAHLRFDAKKFAEAKEDFKPLATLDNNEPDAQTIDAALFLAVCLRELKEITEAKALLEKLDAVKLKGIAAFQVPFQLGNLALEAADNNAAEKSYKKALAAAADLKDLAPANRNAAKVNLAWALRRNNKAEEAAQAFAELVKNDPQGEFAAESLYERGRILVELSKLDDAVQAWKQLAESKPESPLAEKAAFSQGQELAKAARWKDATAAFEAYLKKFPQGPSVREAYCGLAEARLQDQNSDGAREAFLKVLGEKGADEGELDDTSERALLGLAEMDLKKDNPMDAKKMALRIITERPNSTWRDAAYLAAGRSSEALKEPEKAISYYRKLLSEFPKSTYAPTATERLKILGAPAKE